MEQQSVWPLVSPATPPPVSPPALSSAAPANFSLPTQRPRNKLFLIAVAAIILLAGLAWFIINVLAKNKLGQSTVTLTYWGLFEPGPVFQQVIADYEKDHPKVKINYSQENLKDYRERLQAALSRQGTETESQNQGGTLPLRSSPDIFRIHQSWVPMFGNYLSPLPATVYDAATFEKTFYPSASESLRRQGQYVGIPLEFDGLALFYNEDLFKAVGEAPPRSWGELKRLACKLTVKDGEGRIKTAGAALGTTSNVDQWSDILGLMLLQNGADLANPAFCTKETGSATGESESCLGRDALTFYTLFASDQACRDEETDSGAVWNTSLPSSTYAFATGSLAMYFGNSWRVFEIKELNPSLNFKIVPVPQLEGKNVAWASYWVEAVSKNSKHQAEAWEFLKYLSSTEVLQKLYQTESSLRLFGEPYPRVDMAASLKSQPLVGAFIENAAIAKNWYLSSQTGDNGLNEKIIKYYEDAVNSVNAGQDPTSALTTAGQGVTQILQQYGLSR